MGLPELLLNTIFLLAASAAAEPATAASLPGSNIPAQSSSSAANESLRPPLPSQFNAGQVRTSPTLLNPVAPAGIMSQSQVHERGLVSRALGGVVSDAAHATMALVGTTILNQGVDLPPDDDSKPEWRFFNEPHRKALWYVDWADGSQAKISRLPDGSLQILGGGKRYIMQPEADGRFALFGDYGSMATVTPRPGGGYTILKADGTAEQVLPRQGGGYTVNSVNGVVATILPGVGGKKHVIRGGGFSSGFIQ